jgi:hypothetical protein
MDQCIWSVLIQNELQNYESCTQFAWFLDEAYTHWEATTYMTAQILGTSRHTGMPRRGFKSRIPMIKQTKKFHALGRAATNYSHIKSKNKSKAIP